MLWPRGDSWDKHRVPRYLMGISTWWIIPLSKWVISPVINGISRINPLITGDIIYLLSGMIHQVGCGELVKVIRNVYGSTQREEHGKKHVFTLTFGTLIVVHPGNRTGAMVFRIKLQSLRKFEGLCLSCLSS